MCLTSAYLRQVILYHVLGQSCHLGSVLRVSCVHVNEQCSDDTAQDEPHGSPSQQREHGDPDVDHGLGVLYSITCSLEGCWVCRVQSLYTLA